MPNITDEELREKLFPVEAVDYLESHPSCSKRAAKMYAAESWRYSTKAAGYEFDRAKEKLQRAISFKNAHPELF